MTIPMRLRSAARRRRRGRVPADPASFPFISGDTFRSMADVIIDRPTDVTSLAKQLPNDRGALIFCVADAVPTLAEWAASHDVDRHVLVIHNGDSVHPSETRLLAERLHHVFCLNWLDEHPHVTPIPIGLENARLATNGSLDLFEEGLLSSRTLLRNRARDVPVLCAFAVRTNPNIRQAALDTFASSPGALAPTGRLTPSQHAELLLRTSFVISPPGNGPDCHRTWEAIYLGAVPVVLASAWPFSDDALPVLVVEDWEEARQVVSEDGPGLYSHIFDRSCAQAYFPHYARAILSRLDEAGHGRY